MPRPVSLVSPGRAQPTSPHGEGRSRGRFIGAGWHGLSPRQCLLTCAGIGPTLSLQFNSPRALLSSFWGCESDKSL